MSELDKDLREALAKADLPDNIMKRLTDPTFQTVEEDAKSKKEAECAAEQQQHFEAKMASLDPSRLQAKIAEKDKAIGELCEALAYSNKLLDAIDVNSDIQDVLAWFTEPDGSEIASWEAWKKVQETAKDLLSRYGGEK